jgi:predicted ATPase
LLTILAEQRPLLLILEDLHWATESTLQLLHYLTRQLAQQPVLLLGTYRQEQVGSEHPLTAMQRQLSRENLAHTITLSRLTAAEVQEMVIELMGETAVPLAQRLYNETEGNPFYLMETMQTLFETEAITRQGKQQDWTMVDLPLAPGIMAAIEARVQRLSPSAQDAVRLAAVLGREFDYDLLNAVWGQGEEQTLAALDDLLRARLIAEGTGALGRDYAFTHHKIQEAVYAALPQTRRWHSHARVAPIMEAHYPLAEVVSELGFHYQQGRQADDSLTPKAVAYLQMAGEQAANQFAHEEAIGYLGQALDVLAAGDAARIPLLLAREKILNMQGDRTAQAQDLAELSQLATTPAQQADIALRQIHYATVTGKYDKAITIAQAAIPSAPTDELRISIRLQWGLALHHQGGFETAVTQFQTALTQARAANLPQLSAKCLTSLSLCYWRQSQYDEAEACCSAALEICRQPKARDRVTEANALGNLGILARYRSDYATAKTYFEQALTLWREIGLRRGQGFNLLNLGVIGFDTADYAAGKEYFAQALTIFREIEDRSSEQRVLSNLSVIAYFQGDFMETIRLAQEALAICREIGERHGEGVNFANLGVATAALGQYDEAEGYYEQSLTIRRERGDRRGEGIALHGLGDVALGRGDLATAVTHCQQAHTILHEIGDRAEEGLVLRTLAEIEMANGRFPTARSHLDEALQISQQINSPLLEGQVLTVLADLACREGEWETAVAHSQQALTIAEQIGAQALAGDAWLANGLALAGLGRQKEAVQAFNEAIRIRRRIKQEHLLTEPLAGLARIKQ